MKVNEAVETINANLVKIISEAYRGEQSSLLEMNKQSFSAIHGWAADAYLRLRELEGGANLPKVPIPTVEARKPGGCLEE